MSTFLDAAAAVSEWANGLTATLTGAGRPMPLGLVMKRQSGAADTPYGLIVELPSAVWGGAENGSMRASISVQIYGPTKKSACDAAVAYAEEVETLTHGARIVLPSTGATIVGADGIDGPQWLPDGDEPRYVVDADFYFL